MARKKSAQTDPPSLPGIGASSIPTPRKALPSTLRELFLPDLVEDAAKPLLNRRDELLAIRAPFDAWADHIRSGYLAAQNEVQAQRDFLNLWTRLGYPGSAAVETGQPWALRDQFPIAGEGAVDAAIGAFRLNEEKQIEGEPLVLLELKKAGADLDARGSRRESPVDQLWRYLNACKSARWGIVTNFDEVRLYARQESSKQVHRVFLRDLDDAEAFAAFVAVFGPEGLLGRHGAAPVAERLLAETDDRQRKVTDELYDAYRDRRRELVAELVRLGVGFEPAVSAAQLLLDRILFLAFAEDRGLVENNKLLQATSKIRIPGLSTWGSFRSLFRAIDRGDPAVHIHGYNGNLFKRDPILDDPDLELDEEKWPVVFAGFGDFNFRDEATVDVLGSVFERSIPDLEDLKERGPDGLAADLERKASLPDRKRPGQRKLHGVFYTHPSITGYLVGAALDPPYREARSAAAARHGVPDDPAIEPEPARLAAYARELIGWLDGLTVCDPACGSGAFLVAAYDWFEDHRLALLDDLARGEPGAPECWGNREQWRERVAPEILRRNLYGVDLSPESVEIARLSLWIRTARPGQSLADLSRNIRAGNSVVDDRAFDADRAFDWRGAFPEVFGRGGFDAVVGNPPYVRQERLGPIKPHLQARFSSFHGMADLYVYFYELGLDLLRPGGRLSYVVTNKWMKAGYGEPLRRLFAEHTWVESLVDFGHAKRFFPDADVFPCFLVARKPLEGGTRPSVRGCSIPRDLARLEDLRSRVAEKQIEIDPERFGAEAWNLEPPEVVALLRKIEQRGIPLVEYAGVKPYYGIKTGLNEAFLIDTATRDRIIREDPKSAQIIKPYLRGQDIERWVPEWAGLWMIFARRGIDIDAYPGVRRHLEMYRERLEPRPAEWSGEAWPGRKPGGYPWYELQDPIEYWELFAAEKIVYQEIQFHPSYALDRSGMLGNNKTFFIPTGNLYLLAVLNAPAVWWRNWRALPHMKDEALSPVGLLMEGFPVPDVSRGNAEAIEACASRLMLLRADFAGSRHTLLDWLKIEHEIETPTQKLRDPAQLSGEAFIAEVKKSRGKKGFSGAALASLRAEYDRTIEPTHALRAEALALENRLHDLVNEAYGLTPEEVRLMWDTAPPRMPISRPVGV